MKCECGWSLWTRTDRERGKCSSCVVKTWTPEKRDAIARLVAAAFDGSDDAEKDRRVDEALKHERLEIVQQ